MMQSVHIIYIVEPSSKSHKQNQIFSLYHMLLPVNLTWLSQVYGKMFSFPVCWFVLENVYPNNIVFNYFN